jgi:hypothetical protein
MEVSDRLIELLGKPDSDSDPDFLELVAELGPYQSSIADCRRYDFVKQGFSVLCGRQCIACIIFHVATFAVKRGYRHPFTGVLPWGIATSDTRMQVRSKLGLEPIKAPPDEGYQTTDGDGRKTRIWPEIYGKQHFEIHTFFNSNLGDLSMLVVGNLKDPDKLEVVPPGQAQDEYTDKQVNIDQELSNQYRQHAVRRRPARKPPHRH